MMLSSIKLDYLDRNTGRGLEPIIKVDIKDGGDDPRDRMLQTIFQQLPSKYLQVSWSSPKYVPTSDGNLGADTTIYLFRPEDGNEISISIHDNSIGVRNFLQSINAKWEAADHYTMIYAKSPIEFFEMGQKLAEYKASHPQG
jgi:hypothetical protein